MRLPSVSIAENTATIATRAITKGRRNSTHRSRELHGGRDQDLARRDLEAVNGTRNGRHCARLFEKVSKEIMQYVGEARDVFTCEDA